MLWKNGIPSAVPWEKGEQGVAGRVRKPWSRGETMGLGSGLIPIATLCQVTSLPAHFLLAISSESRSLPLARSLFSLLYSFEFTHPTDLFHTNPVSCLSSNAEASGKKMGFLPKSIYIACLSLPTPPIHHGLCLAFPPHIAF